MEIDRSVVINEFLHEVAKDKSDIIGKVGRLEVERLEALRRDRKVTPLGINTLISYHASPNATLELVAKKT